MSPRSYRMGARRADAEATRQRIVTAARRLLAGRPGAAGFTVDAVAREAGVARMTVYYQFGSRAGLLEAVFDSLAWHRARPRLVEAAAAPDALAGLQDFARAAAGAWSADRALLRRLHGLAAVDTDVERAWQEVEAQRRAGLHALAARLVPAGERAVATDVLAALVSFETFQALAGARRGPAEVAELMAGVAEAALDNL